MNQYTIQFSCGQINYIQKFFADYQDAFVTTNSEMISKLRANILVKTKLQKEEAQKYLEKIFKQSKYGCALHFSTEIVD
ncbi:hypothetical protein [Bacillus sp. B1-b2]|uniref:hypothetical protein n=1 Tax=Bacillus sp. B1-b2 TaxID=2653201 RepID=UPI001261FD22|nr:hypothetical protein [Bacillus sp. B1-b2]KAB7668845.1 hypothetical protein F9279_11575 [Bacillus sp. B1-b2]